MLDLSWLMWLQVLFPTRTLTSQFNFRYLLLTITLNLAREIFWSSLVCIFIALRISSSMFHAAFDISSHVLLFSTIGSLKVLLLNNFKPLRFLSGIFIDDDFLLRDNYSALWTWVALLAFFFCIEMLLYKSIWEFILGNWHGQKFGNSLWQKLLL